MPRRRAAAWSLTTSSASLEPRGVVTVSGTVNGVAATSKPQLLAAVWDGEMLVGSFVVYVANAKLDNGAYCHVFDVVLSDTDEDGKLDFAAVPEG